jgi:endonuclease/exonuclease/phosphatase family metal-dependent hydrolase
MANIIKREFDYHKFKRMPGKGYILLLLFCSTVGLNYAQPKDDLRVMTFNIRYGTADDGDNNWMFRTNLVFETIKSFNPDVLGLQEALQFQIDELINQLPEYNYVGVGRDDGKSAGEFSCILYRKERFEIDSTNTFWFSETPEVVASKSWGNNITRICTWAKINDKLSKKSFYVFNVHLDHESQNSREKSSTLLMNQINEKLLPVILTGDFNCGDENPVIKTILSSGLTDTFRKLHTKRNDEGTFNSFKGETNGDKIDFIFTSKEFEVFYSTIVRTNYNGKFPSDHFPVTAIISF